MLIADDRYLALVKALTELDQEQCPFSSANDRRTWAENQIQVALCAADIYPASSADCDSDQPSIAMHGEEPSAELVGKVELMLAGLGSASVH
ncbi:hypothetical protein QCM77_05735 [Bradyrhizobium sp. SSUT18]|uniref:hypothetical protein n=1 Tax=Bradyrhizobium sp. SSUT18 TaxID=3040602 RepID=UPI0024470C9C|nr:hypothetical protein [Bradyrhizobium sp. SSUT18]MDH2399449.1 hypothetical protein [Bradyrhizobium sp. SSUT18]